MSPLIFAIVVDMLLRKLAAIAPGDLVRAFADDTAVVMADLWASLPLVHRVFDEFARISSLRFNLPRTVVIPQMGAGLGAVGLTLATACPDWAGVQVCTSGKYSWGSSKAQAKAISRGISHVRNFCREQSCGGEPGLGLFYAARFYNVFGITVLSFVAQLETPPDYMYDNEQVAL